MSGAVAVLALLGSAGAANAATVAVGPEETELGGPPVIFTGAPGESNDLDVSSIAGDPDAVLFRDSGAPITAGEGCAAQADGATLCRVTDIAGVRVLLDDGDDRLDASKLRDQNPPPQSAETTFFAVEVDAADGADTLIGADATYACLDGGAGDDVIASAVTALAPKRAVCGPIGGAGNDVLSGGPVGEELDGGAGVDTINAGGGRDFVTGGPDADAIELGAGRDFGRGGGAADRLDGGAGADSVINSPGADLLLGGVGNDVINLSYRDGEGSDELRGGSGVDTVRYLCRSCQVSLNARADDGESGQADDNALEVENVITRSTRFDVVAEHNVSVGSGNDVLSGDAGANLLDGTRGPDLITGARGEDRLIGGPGSDRLRAADGERDFVSCGDDDDSAAVDRSDRTRGCERVRVA